MTNTTKQILLEQLQNHTARVAILGLGYVGLPLAVVFAEAGFRGDRHRPGSSARWTRSAAAKATSRMCPPSRWPAWWRPASCTPRPIFPSCGQADAVSICVPTPLRKTGDPDLSFIVSATEELAKYVHPGMVVVLESTTYPGHHPRGAAAQAGRGERPDSRRGFLPGLLARAGRPGPRGLDHHQHPQGDRRDHPGLHRGGRRLVLPGAGERLCRSPRPKWPRWPSCWKTPSA